MENQKLTKIKNYIGMSQKAGYCIIGVDNFKSYSHKLYLVLMREDLGQSGIRQVNNIINKTQAQLITLSEDDFNFAVNMNNCKLMGIKNKGISEQIEKIIRGVND